MSETIRGHHTATQTLTAAAASVTITGAITAYGPAGLYLRQGNTAQINAALFAPANATFTIFNQGYIGAVIPGSPSQLIDYGIALGGAAILANTGTITGPAGIGAFGLAASTLTNSGLITTSYYAGIEAFNAPASIANSGTIAAEGIGIQLHQGGLVTNTGGMISGATGPAIASEVSTTILNTGTLTGTDGIALLGGAGTITNAGAIRGSLAGIAAYSAPLTLSNTGTISSQYGLLLDAGGQITNAGLISGNAAIKATGPLALTLLPGGRFGGAVDDTSGTGQLTLAGAAAGSFNLGAAFFGIPGITFAAGSTWTLEGTVADLASGQSISGFSATDVLVLDGFAATSETIGAAGLTLAGAAGTETIAVNRLPHGRALAFSSYFGNTTLAAGQASGGNLISTITSFFTTLVTPGYGSFAENLTLAATGTAAAGADVYAPGATLSNFGTLNAGAGLGAGAAIFNTGIIAGITSANGGTIINAGTIESLNGEAILATGALSLILDPGAAFSGTVEDSSGAGQITLAGTTAGYLALTSFSGFNAINFAAGATWALAGSLAAGQAITGFAPADTLILEGFAATSYSLAPGIGLILTNASASQTLGLAAAPGQSFTLATAAGNTTITDSISLPGITISTSITSAPIAVPDEPITITPTGTIDTGTFPAIYLGATVANVYVLNSGALITTGSPLPAIFANGAYAVINNLGTIDSQQGANLSHHGTLLNQGQISGPVTNYGVLITGSSLNNSGTIAALVDGVIAFASCAVSNSGAISGSEFGVILEASTLNNSGSIASAFTGAEVFTYGSLINAGLITSSAYGIKGLGVGFISNRGTIWGNQAGASLDFSSSSFAASGGFTDTGLPTTFINTGSIGGFTYGIVLGAGMVDLTNAGTIAGDLAAIQAAGALTLTAEPGAVFNGAVNDAASAGILILAGTASGSLDIAPDFSGFSTLDFASGSSWTLEGSPTQLAGGETINGFAAGDTLILDSFAASTYSYVTGTGLVLANASGAETLDLTGISGVTITSSATAGTDITTAVACFLRGTRILTPRGDVPIEDLRIGDRVNTMHGDLPIRWIGRRAYAARFFSGNPNALPIRIRRHAIAPNIPSRDLYISPDHAVCEGGVLIHAHRLQNGISIHQPERDTDVEYFHLEFDTHTILFAENFSVESFIDEDAGNRFHNANTRPAPAKPQKPCLPRVFEGFHLHNIKSRIAARAGIRPPSTLGPLLGVIDECSPALIRGWAQNSAAPEHPVTLEIISGPQKYLVLANAYRPDLRSAGLGSGCHGFSLALPNLHHRITLRRLPDGATLPHPHQIVVPDSVRHPRLFH